MPRGRKRVTRRRFSSLSNLTDGVARTARRRLSFNIERPTRSLSDLVNDPIEEVDDHPNSPNFLDLPTPEVEPVFEEENRVDFVLVPNTPPMSEKVVYKHNNQLTETDIDEIIRNSLDHETPSFLIRDKVQGYPTILCGNFNCSSSASMKDENARCAGTIFNVHKDKFARFRLYCSENCWQPYRYNYYDDIYIRLYPNGNWRRLAKD